MIAFIVKELKNKREGNGISPAKLSDSRGGVFAGEVFFFPLESEVNFIGHIKKSERVKSEGIIRPRPPSVEDRSGVLCERLSAEYEANLVESSTIFLESLESRLDISGVLRLVIVEFVSDNSFESKLFEVEASGFLCDNFHFLEEFISPLLPSEFRVSRSPEKESAVERDIFVSLFFCLIELLI